MKKTKTPKGLYGVEMEYKGKQWIFAQTLQRRMDELGKSDKSIYEALDMDQRTFSTYKRGECFPPANVVFKLAQELNCTSDYLMGLDGATNHECSDISKKTGLPGEAVEILHEAVTTNSNKYQILVDLFDYLLHEYKTYEFDSSEIKEFALTDDDPETGDNSAKPWSGCQYMRMINDTYAMFDYIISALGSMLAITQKTEDYSLPGEQGHREDLLKRVETQNYLNKHGEVVIMAEKAKEYYLREAADKFRDIISAFCDIKMRKNPDYALKVIDVNVGDVKRETMDMLQKQGRIHG